jgi:hypothetical protein
MPVVVMVIVIMVVVVVIMMVVMVMMHFVSHRSGRREGGLLSDGDSAERDRERGGGKEGLDHGKAILLLRGLERVLGPHSAAGRLNST